VDAGPEKASCGRKDGGGAAGHISSSCMAAVVRGWRKQERVSGSEPRVSSLGLGDDGG